MKLANILREVTANRDREMVTGVAEILRDVKDESNREELASKMMRKFDQEGVQYDQLEFLRMANVSHIQPINTVQHNAHHKVTADHTDVRRLAAERLKEIGFTSKKDYGFPYTRVTGTEGTAMFEFSTGENEYQVWVQREENDGFQKGWILQIAFAVLEKGAVMFPGHRPGKSRNFEKEVNDPKNIYKVMNTVVNIAKDEAARLEKAGQKVIRIEFEPTKRQIKDKRGIKMDDPNDDRRANLYVAYLKKEFPGAQIKSTHNKGKIWVDIL